VRFTPKNLENKKIRNLHCTNISSDNSISLSSYSNRKRSLSRDKMSGWNSFCDESTLIHVNPSSSRDILIKSIPRGEGFHFVFTYQNYWCFSSGIIVSVTAGSRTKAELVEDRRAIFSDAQYEVFPRNILVVGRYRWDEWKSRRRRKRFSRFRYVLLYEWL